MIGELRRVRRMLPLLPGARWAIPLVVTLGVAASLAEGLGISLFIPLLRSLDGTTYDAHTGNWLIDSLSRLFGSLSQDRRLWFISGAILGSVILRSLLAYASAWLFAWLDARVSHQLRSRVFGRLLRTDYRIYEGHDTGRILNMLSEETWRATEAMEQVVRIVVGLCTLVVYGGLLLLISWPLTVAVAAAMAIISSIARWMTRHAQSLGQAATAENSQLAVRMVEGVEGMKEIRLFGMESREQSRFDASSLRVSAALRRVKVLIEGVPLTYEVLAGVVLVSVLMWTVQSGGHLAGLLVFLFLLYRLQPRLKEIDERRAVLRSLDASIEEVLTFHDGVDSEEIAPVSMVGLPEGGFAPYVSTGTVGMAREGIGGDRPGEGEPAFIEFEEVSFSYGPALEAAVSAVSLRIRRFEVVALVGPSGAGKSTLIQLLLGLYRPHEGEIRVEGRRLADEGVRAWRGRVGVVSQDAFLFNATVRENIAYGLTGATDEQIRRAARQAQADEFIRALPNGYDTPMGDRATRVSGGQRQRLSLARALVRDPEVLILDEATNAVDTITEAGILETLEALRGRCTLIVIAHRLATVRSADHIVVMDGGRVVEEGTFGELRDRRGLFSRMYTVLGHEGVAHETGR